MHLFKIAGKRISKRYFYPLLSLALVCILLFTSFGVGQAQEEQSSPESTPESTPAPTTTVIQQPTSDPLTVADVASIRGVSPKELYVSIPQSLVAESFRADSQDKLNLVITGNNFPKAESSAKNKITVRIGNPPDSATTNTVKVAEDGQAIFATFSNSQLKNLPRGTHPIKVEVAGNATSIDPQITEEQLQVNISRPISSLTTLIVFGITTLATLFLVGIIYLLAKESKRGNVSPKSLKSPNQKELNALEWLLLERQTNTYSLARTQFVWWLTIIVFGYLFLFIGRGIIQNIWEFIPLSGFAYTFLISLVTLVTAQATSNIRGTKGSGDVNPSWSDLVVHGGIIALERVQQVVWNLIIGIAFIVILLVTYTTASSLPSIPQEILVLMGISAGGYISGKAVRKAGPNVTQVVLWDEPQDLLQNPQAEPHLTISGEHLSQATSAIVQMVYLDESNNEKSETRIEVKQENLCTQEPDPDYPGEFCKKLRINFKDMNALPDQQWYEWLQVFGDNFTAQKVKITIINADGQRSVWDGSNPVPERKVTAPQSGY
ncbi:MULTISPECIES: hypothetical protein [Calothrix]|uniref:Uncharacterized protein n=2 Tax=Calothrix TaxID=1186 RepID=A0ABR8AAH0_9CYAN|nr:MULTISPECIES: hypothetical protein [Calothrix]MBD2196878.1 hypothetical protein [Calothrix parietina FACHB-288]MBD2225452.1 hypothetical protein [Calothrix anomala FACHB-343]